MQWRLMRSQAASKSQRSLDAAPRPLAAAAQNWRLELFFKSHDDLRSQLPFLKRNSIRRINITNKSNDDQLLDTASILQEAIPDLDLCLHYSLKYNYHRTPAETFAKLQRFCTDQHDQQQQQQQPCAASGTCRPSHRVLLVSGGGKKKALDTVAALKQIQQQQLRQQQQQHNALSAGQAAKRLKVARAAAHAPNASTSSSSTNEGGCSQGSSCWPRFAVAFNPYLPDQAAAETERERLRVKLETGLVQKIYMQMGTDLEKLVAGLEYVQRLCHQLYTNRGDQAPQLLGSVFVPSKRLLAQMRFRPWNGVFLSKEYLSSVAAADCITRKLLNVYAAYNVAPLVETAIKKDEELQYVLDLLSSIDAQSQQGA